MINLRVNGERRELDAPADMPLLWVLRDLLGLTGTSSVVRQAPDSSQRSVALLSRRRLLQELQPQWRCESLNQLLRSATIAWHGATLNRPDWNYDSHSVAFSAEARCVRCKVA